MVVVVIRSLAADRPIFVVVTVPLAINRGIARHR